MTHAHDENMGALKYFYDEKIIYAKNVPIYGIEKRASNLVIFT